MKARVEERGWPAHFIAAANCRFRRNTLVTLGRKRVVVSTVGDWRPKGGEEAEQIGFQKYYETMCFLAIYDKPYWDADTSKEVRVKSKTSIEQSNFKADFLANEMHENVVREFVELLEHGGKPLLYEE